MKKTILIFLTSVSCLSLVACYTTPEMDELRYRTDYESAEGGCSAQTNYMHEGLRNCIESSIEYDDQVKKTVTIVPTRKGTLVIPRAYDDEAMMDTSRIYERVDINDNSVEMTYESAPKNVFENSTAVSVGVPVDSEDAVSENAETVSEVSATTADVVSEASSKKEDAVIIEVTETKKQETKEITKEGKVVKGASMGELEDEDIDDKKVGVVKGAETVFETEIITDPKTTVEAELIAEPDTILEIEEVKTNSKKTAVLDKVKENKASKGEDESEKVADSEKGRKVTVVVKPSNEDLVVSVDLGKDSKAVEQKTETSTVQTQKTKVVKTQKKKEGASKQEKTKTFKKNEKEVLPIEEK